MTTITLDLHPIVDLTDERFYQLCQANPDIRFERTAIGELIIMPPTGWETGNRNIKLSKTGNLDRTRQSPTSLSGEDVLPGFVLNLRGIFLFILPS